MCHSVHGSNTSRRGSGRLVGPAGRTVRGDVTQFVVGWTEGRRNAEVARRQRCRLVHSWGEQQRPTRRHRAGRLSGATPEAVCGNQ